MDVCWVSPALVGLGVGVQALREARNAGRRQEQIAANSVSIASLETVTVDLGQRISKIEGRCTVMEHK